MAKWGGIIANALAGAATGAGSAMVESIKTEEKTKAQLSIIEAQERLQLERQRALAELGHTQAKDLQRGQQDFQRSERQDTQAFTETRDAKKQEWDNFNSAEERALREKLAKDSNETSRRNTDVSASASRYGADKSAETSRDNNRENNETRREVAYKTKRSAELQAANDDLKAADREVETALKALKDAGGAKAKADANAMLTAARSRAQQVRERRDRIIANAGGGGGGASSAADLAKYMSTGE